ncbi:hypothetical protein BDW72DRAFT_209109 [Aspergillus terricola var. indicus]
MSSEPKIQAPEPTTTSLAENDGFGDMTKRGSRIQLYQRKWRVLVLDSWSSLIYVVASTVGQLKWIWFRKGSRQLQGFQSIDDATRGPMGSLLILFQRPGRSLVSLGAMITILALAFEPFMQQILRYPLREALQVTDRALAKQVGAFRVSASDGPFINAIDTGFWESEFEVTPACPSGNCAWPVFDSIGFCTRCEDVTSQAKIENCHNVTFDPNIHSITQSPCNITLPYGYSARQPITVDTQGFPWMRLPTNIVWMVSQFGPGRFGEGPLTKELFELAHAKLTIDNDHSKSYAHPEKGLRIDNVTTCAIGLCSRQYNISVSNGQVSIQVSEPNWGEVFTHEYEYDMGGGNFRPRETTCWRSGPGGPDDLPTIYHGSDDALFINESQHVICPDALLYDYLGSGITGFTSEYWAHADNETNLFSFDDRSPDPLPIKVGKFISSGLEEVLSNVAASVTKYAFDQSNRTVIGEMGVAESYVTVEWRWLVFPGALLLSTLALLVSTILINKTEHLDLWKSSTLPLLYYGLEEDTRLRSSNMGSVSAMDEMAEGLNVKLQESSETGALMLRR